MASPKIEFATVRELEKKTFRFFGYGGSAFGVGLILTVFGLAIVGAPLMVASGACIIGAMAYVSMLGKEPSRAVFCPYCAMKNDVYVSRTSFRCDICKRPILVSADGVPTAADPVDTRARYNT